MEYYNDREKKSLDLKQTQEQIIKKISKQCNQTTFLDSICSEQENIKHFKLTDGTHVYSISGKKPVRVISDRQLPNISYFSKPWTPTLLPNHQLANIHGCFINVNSSSVTYSIYDHGNRLCLAGYRFRELKNKTKIRLFCRFNLDGISEDTSIKEIEKYDYFSSLPNDINTIVHLIKYKLYKQSNLPKEIKNKILDGLPVLKSFEESSLNKLDSTNYFSTSNLCIKKDESDLIR